MAQVFLGALAELGRVGEAAPRVERGHGQCEHWDHSRKGGASFPEPAVFTLDRVNPVNFVPAVGPPGAARPPRPHVDGRSDRPRELAPLFIHSGLGLLDDYTQWDFSGSVDLSEVFGEKYLPELTLDVQNIFQEKQRSYFQFPNAAFSYFSPGRQILVGLRGRF